MWRIWMLFDPRRALVAMAIFVFTIIIYVLPTRSVEAGNRHNKPQVAPFTIAG